MFLLLKMDDIVQRFAHMISVSENSYFFKMILSNKSLFSPSADVLSFDYARNPLPGQPTWPTSMNHHHWDRKLENLSTKKLNT